MAGGACGSGGGGGAVDRPVRRGTGGGQHGLRGSVFRFVCPVQLIYLFEQGRGECVCARDEVDEAHGGAFVRDSEEFFL